MKRKTKKMIEIVVALIIIVVGIFYKYTYNYGFYHDDSDHKGHDHIDKKYCEESQLPLHQRPIEFVEGGILEAETPIKPSENTGSTISSGTETRSKSVILGTGTRTKFAFAVL